MTLLMDCSDSIAGVDSRMSYDDIAIVKNKSGHMDSAECVWDIIQQKP
jgi:hypothetical protein